MVTFPMQDFAIRLIRLANDRTWCGMIYQTPIFYH